MRSAALLSVICTFIALVLSFLCIFAGSKRDMLEGYDIVTFNTSRIAVDVFQEIQPSASSNDDGDDSGLSGWINSIENATETTLQNIGNDIGQAIEDDLNSVLSSVAKTLGLHDWYSIHVLDFCEGFYSPYSNSTNKNVTYCSNSTSLFTFNMSSVLQQELNEAGIDVNLSMLHWPEAIDDMLATLHTAFMAMFVLYCISIVLIAGSLVASAVGIFLHGRGSAISNVVIGWLAFVCLLIASAAVTYAADKSVEVVNKYGADINVSAKKGSRFLALTWTATALMAIAGIAWTWETCVGIRKGRMTPKKWEG